MPAPTPSHPVLSRRQLLRAGLHTGLGAGLGALLAACGGASDGGAQVAAPTDHASTSPASTPPPSPGPSPTPPPSPTVEQRTLPTGIDPHRIRIEAIGVDTSVIDLAITAEEVEVPEDFDDTGWWVQTRRPGEIGPSVIGGHVDSTSGPAVFFRLKELTGGDEVVVEAEDGEQRTFVVDRVIQIDKYERPPEVFGFGEPRPELRLITCGGDFDPSIGHYTDNIVAFCHDPTFGA